jgi:hypothetical protein
MQMACLNSSTISFEYKGTPYEWKIATCLDDETKLEPMFNIYLALCLKLDVEPSLDGFCKCVNKVDGCIALPVTFVEKLVEQKLASKVDTDTIPLN